MTDLSIIENSIHESSLHIILACYIEYIPREADKTISGASEVVAMAVTMKLRVTIDLVLQESVATFELLLSASSMLTPVAMAYRKQKVPVSIDCHPA